MSEEERREQYTKQQRSYYRQQIRERTRHAFRDFTLLYETLDEQERNRIFDVDEDEDDLAVPPWRGENAIALEEGVVDTIAFLYLSLEGPYDSRPPVDRAIRAPFKDVLTKGVRKAEARRQPREWFERWVGVKFEVDTSHIEAIDTDRAIEKLATLKEYELSEGEVRALLRAADPDLGMLGVEPGEGWEEFGERIEEIRRQSDIKTPRTDPEYFGIDEDGSDEE